MKAVVITCNSQDAVRIEKKFGDRAQVRWVGAPSFEKHQLFKVDGHGEILLEIAANLEIENVSILDETECEKNVVDDPTIIEEVPDPVDEIVEPTDLKIEGSHEKIHVFIDGDYEFTTTDFESKKEALASLRKAPEFNGMKLTAKVSNYHNDKLVK